MATKQANEKRRQRRNLEQRARKPFRDDAYWARKAKIEAEQAKFERQQRRLKRLRPFIIILVIGVFGYLLYMAYLE